MGTVNDVWPRAWTTISRSLTAWNNCAMSWRGMRPLPPSSTRLPSRRRYSESVRSVSILLLAAAIPACVTAAAPTFYRDVLPILQDRCQSCHRTGEIAPMPLVTYRDTRPWARAIRDAVRRHDMPPWFADPCCGKFANDRTLTRAEIETLSAWADTGATQGDAKDAPPARIWPSGGNLASPDAIVTARFPPLGQIRAGGASL